MDRLESIGYEVVYLEDMTVLEQISLFAQADVIALHGAALTNIIYARKDAVIIEISHVEGCRIALFT